MAQAPDKPLAKKLHIKTFGCQMNDYDSERMTEALGTEGYVPTADAAEADLVILNTCHIREKAAEKVYSELGRVRLAKERRRREGRDTLIAVAGCVAQAEGHEIMARAPAVDLVVGPQSYHRLAGLVAEAATSGKGVVATDFPAEDKFAHLPERSRQARAGLRPSSPCRKAATSSAPSASCPIHGAPNIRARRRRSSPRRSGSARRARARSRCSGRT